MSFLSSVGSYISRQFFSQGYEHELPEETLSLQEPVSQTDNSSMSLCIKATTDAMSSTTNYTKELEDQRLLDNKIKAFKDRQLIDKQTEELEKQRLFSEQIEKFEAERLIELAEETARFEQEKAILEMQRLVAIAEVNPLYYGLSTDQLWELREKQIVHLFKIRFLNEDQEVQNDPSALTEGRCVRLIQEGSDLKYQVISYIGKTVLLEGIIYQNLTPERMDQEISKFKKFEVFLRDDGSPKFTKPYRRWQLDEGRELRLLRGPKEPVWQLLDTNGRKDQRIRTDFPGVIFPNRGCGSRAYNEIVNTIYSKEIAKGTLNFGQDPSQPQNEISEEERFSYLADDLDIMGVQLRNDPNEPPFRIYVQPKIIKSQFNDQVSLSKITWGVTLIRHGGNCDKGGAIDRTLEVIAPKLVHWHGQIVIEGIAKQEMTYVNPCIKKGASFVLLIDFDGDAKYGGAGHVEIKSLNGKSLQYFERSKVTQTASYKVMRTLEQIQKEMEGVVPLPRLNILGSSSIFAKEGEESCYTWARGKLLDMGVKLFTDSPNSKGSFSANLISVTGNHTQPKEFYKLNPYHDDVFFI